MGFLPLCESGLVGSLKSKSPVNVYKLGAGVSIGVVFSSFLSDLPILIPLLKSLGCFGLYVSGPTTFFGEVYSFQVSYCLVLGDGFEIKKFGIFSYFFISYEAGPGLPLSIKPSPSNLPPNIDL